MSNKIYKDIRNNRLIQFFETFRKKDVDVIIKVDVKKNNLIFKLNSEFLHCDIIVDKTEMYSESDKFYYFNFEVRSLINDEDRLNLSFYENECKSAFYDEFEDCYYLNVNNYSICIKENV